MSTCEIIRLETETVVRLLHENQEFADYFLTHLLTRTARVEADLVDQLFNSSEMRLARALLLLANYGNDGGQEPIPGKGEPRDPRGADWNDPVSREFFHEQVSEVGTDQIQRQAGSSKSPAEFRAE